MVTERERDWKEEWEGICEVKKEAGRRAQSLQTTDWKVSALFQSPITLLSLSILPFQLSIPSFVFSPPVVSPGENVCAYVCVFFGGWV